METRPLGRTGVQVSQICLGTMMFGGRADKKESLRIIDHALDNGVNFVDTADVYAGNESERIVGEALSAGGKRPTTVLATSAQMAARKVTTVSTRRRSKRSDRRPTGHWNSTPPNSMAAMNTENDAWPDDVPAALETLAPGHAFTVPDVTFRKISDEEREDWQTRFAGKRD